MTGRLLAACRRHFGRHALPGAALQLVLGIGLSVLVFSGLRHDEAARARTELEARATQAAGFVQATMREAGATLNALAAFAASQGTPSAPDFDRFSRYALRNVQGIQALAWVETFPREELAAAEARIAAQGHPGFRVTERGPDGRNVPVGARESYTPVMLIHPLESNAAAHGFDLASRADRREALLAARQTGRPVMTPPISLVQDMENQVATIVFQPVTDGSGTFRGYVDGVVRVTELLGRHLATEIGNDIGIAVFDTTERAAPMALHPPGLAATPEVLADGQAAARDISLNGRRWTVVATRAPGGMLAGFGWRSTLALLFGLFVTLTALVFTLGTVRGQRQVEAQVAVRTRELNRTLAELHESQSRLHDFLSIASDWYWETDTRYRLIYRSGGTLAQDGRMPELMALDRMTAEDPELEVVPRRHMLDRHEPFRGLRCILTTEDAQLALTLDGVPVFDNEGAFTGYRGSARDTTAQAKAEAAERSALVAAQMANRSKSAFLANMSHEIRTPMNGLIGMAQILRHSGLTDEQKQHVGVMLRSARHLLTVINDILDYSKLEAGSIVVERIPCSLTDLMNDVASLVRQGAEEKGVALFCEAPEPAPPTVLCDPVRLRQILLNLVTNAVKFTSEGSVRITLHCTAVGGIAAEGTAAGGTAGVDNGAGVTRLGVRLAVTDTGIGMDAATIARLFTRFMQADASSTRRFGGSGLGLSIAQKLAGLLGGEIIVQSKPGGGSTFSLRLELDTTTAPVADVAASSEDADAATGGEAPEAQARLRILVAEDDEINQLVLAGFLEPYGHAVTMTKDGAAVVERLRQGTFDVILMDVMMPGTDGVQATRMIRALAGPERDIPIVALTANAMAGDRETYLAAGMTDYVSKPIARAELYRVIERTVGRRAFARVFTSRPADVAAPAAVAALAAVAGQAAEGGAEDRLNAFIDALDLDLAAPPGAAPPGEAEGSG